MEGGYIKYATTSNWDDYRASVYKDSLEIPMTYKKVNNAPACPAEGGLDISRPLVTSLGFKVIDIVRNNIGGFTGTLENHILYQWELNGTHKKHPELNLIYADETK